MKYEKPEVALLASALESVQTTTTVKSGHFVKDSSQDIVPATETALNAAYEADE